MGGALAIATLLVTQVDPRLNGNTDEQAALQLATQGDYIKARASAEAILAKDTQSIIAQWVLVQVFHNEEVNLARALHLLHKLRNLLEASYGQEPQEAMAQLWHRRLLEEEASLLGEMDRSDEKLRILDQYDRLYQPPLKSRRMWPLMKLERFDEARALGKELILASDVDERISGYNGLLALESEAHNYEESYKWSLLGLENTQQRSCILAKNGAGNAWDVLEYAQVEPLVRAADRAAIDDCPSTSFEHLAGLHLIKGEFQQGLSAFKTVRAAPVERVYRPQFEMRHRGILQDYLYALGRFDDAARLSRQIYDAPDRTGMTSSSRDEQRFADALEYWLMLGAEVEAEKERAAVRDMSLKEWLLYRWRRATLWLQRWEAERVIARLAVGEERVMSLVRPWPSWTAASFLPVFGEGVLRRAADAWRAATPTLADKAQGHFAALRGEAAWRRGDTAAALEHGTAALRALPPEEVLFRLRVQAWLADAAWDEGQNETAAQHFHDVLRTFPTALRILSIALPASVEADDSELGAEAADRLRTSPRLRRGDLGFRVDVRSDGKRLETCLLGPRGIQYDCVSGELGEDIETGARAVLDRFHTTIFAPKIDLTQADIHSLDGSPVRVDADRALDGLLQDGR